MVLHKAEDAVSTPFVEAEFVECFGFLELAIAFVGRGGEVDTADGEFFPIVWIRIKGSGGEKSLAFFGQVLSSEYQ